MVYFIFFTLWEVVKLIQHKYVMVIKKVSFFEIYAAELLIQVASTSWKTIKTPYKVKNVLTLLKSFCV